MPDDVALVQAEAALQRGNGHRALEHLANVADMDRAEPWLLRARAHLLLDEPGAAVEAARRGLTIDPDDPSLLLALASGHDLDDRPADAERALLGVLNRDPEHPEALFRYAELLVNSGDPAGADDITARLPPDAQTVPPVLILRSRIAAALGREREAADFARRAVTADPDSAAAHALIAGQAGVQRRPADLVAASRRAAAIDPDRMASVGRAANYIGHPLMAPIRFIERVGPAQLWIGWIAVIFVGGRYLPRPVTTALTLMYLGLVVYSWIVPWLLGKVMTARGKR